MLTIYSVDTCTSPTMTDQAISFSTVVTPAEIHKTEPAVAYLARLLTTLSWNPTANFSTVRVFAEIGA